MKRHLPFLTATALVLVPAMASAAPRTYEAEKADQFPQPQMGDTIPRDREARVLYARNAAYQAALFGQSAVLTYNQMYDQAIDRKAAGFVGFNVFAHDRDLAGPDFAPFKTPNADTIYSNAYLDLSRGPVLLTVPPTNGRYYTVNFLDLYSNATNISARTHGMKGGRFLIATTDWGGEVPEGVTLFRVTQPYMWILMRIEAENAQAVAEVRRLQRGFTIEPTNTTATKDLAYPAPATLADGAGFLKVLDWVVEHAGVRDQELAHVHGFEGIGVGGATSVDKALADAAVREGVQAGFADATKVITAGVSQNGARIAGWNEPADVGKYGYNYVYRASTNTLGTGANVRAENYAFTTFEDRDGEPLDGSKHDYVLRLTTPPPSDFFWSVTVYDRGTQKLVPNPQKKYLVSDNTKGLVTAADGSVTIRFSRNASGPNAIPTPNGPFYLALRSQGPRREMLTKAWRPTPVQKAPK
jgi:hypothetical protein